ncbi:uncharacterized protein LOC127735318 [Mytilus californianus]|uniref:uncharacterized protein LOC127735318 n=1 Tax=Mytilus californianus TaxID=6549 RepID=UPI002246E8D3|nr:uncharacterized protein LOC127735318 [Mytilus californianus]XP_052101428.1 uncharacterized protein LOC127735318 [Mytilus californianus]XP_052101429.1 uncharacterized protein LOC127735318 [Mytilus californianus]
MDNVIKQGYLKKSRPTAPGSNPANSFLQLFEPTRWFVFGLRNRRPYLEYYEKEQHVFTAQPINNFDLYTCKKVTYTLGRNNRNWTFCLFLEDRVLELTADSREVMLSWCRTLEHTLQNYGALKHVPSEHIYSDYPVRYKPKKSASPPPIEDRDSATPTPPPSEPAPPVPQENGFVPLQRRAGAEYCNSDWVVPEKPESENSEPDTSEDDFVNEEFFKQKRLEAFSSNTLKPISKTDNPIVLHSRSVASLPMRSYSLPAEYSNDTPQLPARPHRNKPVTADTSEPQYSQVNKFKPKPEADSEDVYESAFDFDDQSSQSNHSNRNTLTEQSYDITDDSDEGLYEAAFDVKDTQPLFEKKMSDPIVELPKRKSKLKDIDELSSEKRKSQIAVEENVYSGFNCEEQNDDGKFVDKKADLANNNIKNENIYSNTNSTDIPVSKGHSKENTSQNQNKDHIYSNTDACIIAEATSKETMTNDEESQGTASPVKPPRRNSRNASKKKVDAGYANFDKLGSNNPKKVTDKHEQTVEAVPLPVRPLAVKENIYDFGKCLPPPVNKNDQSKSELYSNLNSISHGSADFKLSSKYAIPPPLNLNFDHTRSDSSSPETPRRLIDAIKMPPKFEPISTKNGLEDLPPSPTSPSTPVNDPGLVFPTVHKSIIDVTDMSHKKQSTPSPKPRHSRPTSHSPKIRHSDKVVKEAQNVPLPKPRLASGKQERPRSLIMPQQYDYMSSVHQPIRKNTGEALYSPVLNKKWFGSQPMPGISSHPKAVVASQPMLNVSSNPASNIASQPVLKTGFQPISMETTDEIYQVPKRARSVKQKHEPQPTFISRDIESNALGSSPSHDGFQFNVPKRQMSGDDNEDEDNDSHDYEDATMRHGEPPLPPRRTTAAALNNRSQSVYVPCNINPEASNKVIVRQTSLRERQRISSAPGLVTVLPLKQSEIDILQEEQQSHGIIVKISPAACQKIALVDSFNGVWIIGWDFKHYPRLSESIHIGDEVTKINDLRVTNAHMAKKALKSCNTEQMDLVIKRLPYAKVMAIRRHQTGENLGLQRLGGTAEITYVDPSGLTAQHGLTKYAPCVESDGTCNWWITEINNRPLNLSFKGNEIEAKLNAVGKDISIVVHPSDFIKELRRQLKKMRNFKDFLAVA